MGNTVRDAPPRVAEGSAIGPTMDRRSFLMRRAVIGAVKLY